MIDSLIGGTRVADADRWAEHDELQSAWEFFDLSDIRVRDPRVGTHMLIAMADESGFQTDGYFGMAGYIGESDVWSELNRRWPAALRKSNAPFLHMKDFAGFRGPYIGWTEKQRRTLLQDCILS